MIDAGLRRVPYLDLRAQHERLAPQIRAAMDGVLSTTSFILGPAVDAFEREFAQYCGTEHCVTVHSGTAALHLALLAHGIGPGDEVVTQANTYIATLEAIVHAGGRPVLVDVTSSDFTIDLDAVRRAVTPKTKAVVGVHLFGQPCDVEGLRRTAAGSGIVFIEDASQAHGARSRGERVGSSGTVCFSFYPGKNLGAAGDGGAIVTDDAAIAERLRLLRNHGSRKKYQNELVGYNYRLDALQCAILSVKLPHLDRWTSERRRVARLYDELLQGVHKPRIDTAAEHVYHVYPVLVENRDAMRTRLQEFGIGSNVHYPVPCHLQPAYRYLGYVAGDFPNSEFLSAHELSLPVYPELEDEAVAYVAETLTGLNPERPPSNEPSE